MTSGDYDRLADAELAAAAAATSPEARKGHLDQAATYAYLAERCLLVLRAMNDQ